MGLNNLLCPIFLFSMEDRVEEREKERRQLVDFTVFIRTSSFLILCGENTLQLTETIETE